MNFNPWNVASIDEFSYLHCPECTFLVKEKTSFQDHAKRNHPLSAVLFSKEVITFLNELNQLTHLSNEQKCKDLMNFNPWNVASVDEFSFFNCPECDFHAKEKKNFQDHATRNHPLSAVLFSEEVITFLNELNQLKNLTNDQKCEELVLKQNLSDPVSSFKNDVSNVEKRQQLQKVSEETKKDFSLPTEIVKIISLQREEKLEKNINTFHPLPTIPCEDQNESSGVLREEFLESNKAINFSGIRVEVIEVDYNDLIPSKLQQNFAQIESSNSDVLISSVNCDEFQEFQTVLPSDTELTVSSVHDQIKCLICSESFPSKNQLKEHITSVHDEVKQYPCSKCGKCFSRIKLLLDHIYVVQ